MMMSPTDAMHRIDTLLSHVWMVRAFLKHSEETEEDEELAEVHRTLYDCMLALGAPLKDNDASAYLKQAQKKFGKLRRTAERFAEIQPEISDHTNFQMAARSLTSAVEEIGRALATVGGQESGVRNQGSGKDDVENASTSEQAAAGLAPSTPPPNNSPSQ
jgi:cob(I)alamin adenosyltransferase